MTKEIKLTQNQVAIVDDWWYEELNQHKWLAQWNPSMKSYYARRNSSKKLGKQKAIIMHAVVMNTPKGMHTDHINHNTLDNREENLRVCTPSQNSMNAKKRSDNTTGYRGVTFSVKDRKFQAQIHVGDRQIYLGQFDSASKAAEVYNTASIKYHGEFAFQNKITDSESDDVEVVHGMTSDELREEIKHAEGW